MAEKRKMLEIAKKDENGKLYFEYRDVTGLPDNEVIKILETEDCFYNNYERDRDEAWWRDINESARKGESIDER